MFFAIKKEIVFFFLYDYKYATSAEIFKFLNETWLGNN